MQRDLLLLQEMIDAGEQAIQLVVGADVEALDRDRQRRDALLWNFTVLGEGAAQTQQYPSTAHKWNGCSLSAR